MTISSTGALTIALGDNNPGDENISGGAQNVTMAQLRLSASAVEDIEINSIAITTTGSGIRNDEVVSPDMRIYKDVNNNGVYESSIDELITTQDYVGNAWNFPGNTTLTFSSRYIYAGTTENWLIVNNYVNGDVNDNLALSIVNNSDVTATGVSSAAGVNVTGATLNAGVKTVTAGGSAGSLALSLGANDPGYHNIASGASEEVMLDLQLTSGSEAVQISEIGFTMSGSGNESVDVDSVRLIEDVNGDGRFNPLDYDRQIGSTLSGLDDDGNLIFSGLSEIINQGESEDWLVLYDFDGAQTINGETYQVHVSGNAAVVDTGVTSGEAITNTGAPLSGGIGTISATGSLSIMAGPGNPQAKYISSSEQNLVMMQIALSATATEAVDITSASFTASGTANESTDLDSARLYFDVNTNGVLDLGIDRQLGSTLTSFTDNGNLTFGSLTEQIAADGSALWLVIYNLAGNGSADESFRSYVAQGSDITATGATSSNAIVPSGTPVQGNAMTISSTGALTIALGDNNPGDENISGGAQNVTMAQLRLSASAVEDIEINSIAITTTGSGIRNDEVVSPDMRIYKDVNNNGVYESSIDELITTQDYVGNAWNFPGNTTLTFSSRYIYAGTTENWLIVNNYVNGDVNDNLALSIVNNSDVTATGVSSAAGVNVTGATLNAGVKTVTAGTIPGTLSLGGWW